LWVEKNLSALKEDVAKKPKDFPLINSMVKEKEDEYDVEW
jgi:hypothetical protein